MSERKTIYLCLAHMSEEGVEQKYVKEAFDTNWVVPMGPNVTAFEKDLEQFVGSPSQPSTEGKASAQGEGQQEPLAPKVVCLSAGTAAVHLALIACGVGQGDEVCVQSFTFCASSHPITYLGAKPVFIDSERDTWNMDPQLLELAILDRKAKTGRMPKAIIPVALYGMPYDCERIMAVASKYGIPVIEDAAEGMGSRFAGKMLGTFGRFGVLSFNGNKMITTSGGGALICNGNLNQGPTAEGAEVQTENLPPEDDASQIMWYATQARDAYPYYEHTAIGYNYRMSNVCAGIGRGQMTVVDAHIAHHKHVQQLYRQLLKDVPGITLHEQPSDPRYDSNFWLCAATLDENVRIKGQDSAYKQVVTTAVGGAAGVIKAVESATTECQPNDNVEALRVYMLERKVECRPVWKPMHKQPVYAGGALNVERLKLNDEGGTLNVERLKFNDEGIAVSGEGGTFNVQRSTFNDKGIVCVDSGRSVAYVNGVSEEIFKVGFCLPAGPCVTDEDVHYIVETLKSAIESQV
jgi:dTDP-4-amino-4,6-dideoxygalactose transaminase